MVLSQPNVSFNAFVALSLNLTTTAVPLILTSSTSDIPLNMTPTIEFVQPPSDHPLTNIVVIFAVVSLALLATGIVLVFVIVVLVLR